MQHVVDHPSAVNAVCIHVPDMKIPVTLMEFYRQVTNHSADW